MSKGKHGWGKHGHHGNGKIIFLGQETADTFAPDPATIDFRHKIAGFGGDDMLTGGTNRDHIWGGDGNDTINGDAGRDHLWGGAGNDTIDGGADRDKIWGGSGDDTLSGGDGNDHVEGGSGIDHVNGGNGNDSLRGGMGDDFLDGGADSDVLRGGSGNDELTGGTGADVFKFGAISGSDTVMDFTVHGPDPLAPAADADLLDVRGLGLADYAALQALMVDGPDGTIITWLGADGVVGGTDDVIILVKGVAMASLTESDFLIV